MAIIERPSDEVEVVDQSTPSEATPESSYGVFRRPVETTGWKSWLFTIDHKKTWNYVWRCCHVFLRGRWH